MEGKKVGVSLRGLSPLLDEWILVVKDYCRASGWEDNPWWYNERATLGTLAGAAWRLENWGALEEYATDKRGKIPSDGSERLASRGRCDLYVYNSSSSYAIEAKQAWQGVSNEHDCVRYKKSLAAANMDARSLGRDEADSRVAVVFTVPYMSINSVMREGVVSSELVEERLFNFIDLVLGGDCDAVAWVFPGDDLSRYVNRERGVIFPGVVVSMKKWLRGV